MKSLLQYTDNLIIAIIANLLVIFILKISEFLQKHIQSLPKFLKKQLRKIFAKQLLKVKANRNNIYKLNYEIMKCQNLFILFIISMVTSLLFNLLSFDFLYYLSVSIFVCAEIKWLMQKSYIEDLVKYSKAK